MQKISSHDDEDDDREDDDREAYDYNSGLDDYDVDYFYDDGGDNDDCSGDNDGCSGDNVCFTFSHDNSDSDCEHGSDDCDNYCGIDVDGIIEALVLSYSFQFTFLSCQKRSIREEETRRFHSLCF